MYVRTYVCVVIYLATSGKWVSTMSTIVKNIDFDRRKISNSMFLFFIFLSHGLIFRFVFVFLIKNQTGQKNMEQATHYSKSGTAKNWVFTLAEPNVDINAMIRLFNSWYDNKVIDFVNCGLEISPAEKERAETEGREPYRHLQGFLHLTERKGLGFFRSQIISVTGESEYYGWWSKQKYADENNIMYTSKDGNVVLSLGDARKTKQGARNDIYCFRDAARAGEVQNLGDVIEHHPTVLARHEGFTHTVMNYYNQSSILASRNDNNIILRMWQYWLCQLLAGSPDDRTINFVVDVVGNIGKTFVARNCQFIMATKFDKNLRVEVLRPGKMPDMASSITGQADVYLMDVPRAQSEFLQYGFLEQLKDGFVFSSKYHSTMKAVKPCHVVVFMNEEPDMSKLSEDRYHVIRVENEHLVPYEPPVPPTSGPEFSSDQAGDGPSSVLNFKEAMNMMSENNAAKNQKDENDGLTFMTDTWVWVDGSQKVLSDAFSMVGADWAEVSTWCLIRKWPGPEDLVENDVAYDMFLNSYVPLTADKPFHYRSEQGEWSLVSVKTKNPFDKPRIEPIPLENGGYTLNFPEFLIGYLITEYVYYTDAISYHAVRKASDRWMIFPPIKCDWVQISRAEAMRNGQERSNTNVPFFI